MTRKRIENAVTIRRIPKTEEFFNLGKQPSIPTRGLSTIISDKPKRKTLKFSINELANNRMESTHG